MSKRKPFIGKDIKYKAIFDHVCHDDENYALQAVVDAVREDESRKVSHPQLMDEIQARDTTIQDLENTIKSLKGTVKGYGDSNRALRENAAQPQISMGENVGWVHGPYEAVKAVQKLIIDGEGYRKEITKLKNELNDHQYSIARLINGVNHEIPPPPPPKRVLSEDSRTLTIVVNAVKRFFGGKS